MPLVEVRPGCRDRGLGAGKPGCSESLILSGGKNLERNLRAEHAQL